MEVADKINCMSDFLDVIVLACHDNILNNIYHFSRCYVQCIPKIGIFLFKSLK